MPTAIFDAFDFADYETEIKDRLGISGSAYDARLARMFNSAKRFADTYTSNPFDGSSDLMPTPVPDDVIEGVIRYMETAWSLSGIVKGTAKVKTGALEVQYTTTEGVSPQEAAEEAAGAELDKWCVNVGLC